MSDLNFVQSLKQFLVQATGGTLVAFIRTGRPVSHSLLFQSLLFYLNGCWHSYGKKNDMYIIKTFDNLLSHEIIKGSVCLLFWFKKIGKEMLDHLDLKFIMEKCNGHTIDETRTIIHSALSGIFDIVFPKLEKVSCKGNECDNSYDNEDLF